MFASFINALLCCLLLASYFGVLKFSATGFLLIVSLILALNILGAFLIARRNRQAARVHAQLAEMLANFNAKSAGMSVFEQLKTLAEELAKERARINLVNNRSEFLRASVGESIQSLRNINRVLNYISEQNFEEIKTLIKAQNCANIQTLAERAKLSFSYETHYDQQPLPRLDGLRAAIVTKDALEAYALEQILLRQGMCAQRLSTVNESDKFDLFIVDENCPISLPNCLKLGNSQRLGHLRRPYDRFSLIKAIWAILQPLGVKKSNSGEVGGGVGAGGGGGAGGADSVASTGGLTPPDACENPKRPESSKKQANSINSAAGGKIASASGVDAIGDAVGDSGLGGSGSAVGLSGTDVGAGVGGVGDGTAAGVSGSTGAGGCAGADGTGGGDAGAGGVTPPDACENPKRPESLKNPANSNAITSTAGADADIDTGAVGTDSVGGTGVSTGWAGGDSVSGAGIAGVGAGDGGAGVVGDNIVGDCADSDAGAGGALAEASLAERKFGFASAVADFAAAAILNAPKEPVVEMENNSSGCSEISHSSGEPAASTGTPASAEALLTSANFGSTQRNLATAPTSPTTPLATPLTPPRKDVLIFMPSDLHGSQMLHEANKHASANVCAASLSDFKRYLAQDFKIILFSDVCVAYDYEAVKSLILRSRARNSQLFVMLLCEGNLRHSFDFADQIFKNSSQTAIIEALKKHL